MFKTSFTSQRRAFSRTELLLSMGAVSILSAVAFPAFQQAREKASASNTNRAHLRQIYGATRQYLQDNDGGFMPAGVKRTGEYWWGKVSDTSVDYTRGPLWPYLQSVEPLRSPAFPLRLRPVVGGVAFGYNGRQIGGSFFKSEDDTPENVRPATLSQIKNPRRTVLFADSARWNTFTKGKAPFLEENVFIDSPFPEQYPTFHGRHNGFGHVLFADGSIEAFKPMMGVRPAQTKNAPKTLGHLPQNWFDRN